MQIQYNLEFEITVVCYCHRPLTVCDDTETKKCNVTVCPRFMLHVIIFVDTAIDFVNSVTHPFKLLKTGVFQLTLSHDMSAHDQHRKYAPVATC